MEKFIKDLIEKLREIASDLKPFLKDTLIEALNKLDSKNAMAKQFQPFLDALLKFLNFYIKKKNKDSKETRKELIKLAMIASTKFLFISTCPDKINDKILPYVEPFFDFLFSIIDISKVLETKDGDDALELEIAGLRARLKSTDIFIKKVLQEEHVDEPALQGLISHVDIHIGIDEIGKLKCSIKRQMIGKKDNWEKCLDNIKLLLRVYNFRHALLLRLIACLKLKDYSRSTSCVLESLIEQEKEDAKKFLKFLSTPSKKHVGVIALFNPSEHKELATFLEEMGLPSRPKLDKLLHKKVFVIRTMENSTISIARSISLFHTIFGMTTSDHNVRNQFKFTNVKDSFNLFYIQSPDENEYLYMTENKGCMYGKKLPDPESTAQWKIIEVYKENTKTNTFVFCTKKWPGKFLHLDSSYWETTCRLIGITYGQRNKEGVRSACLFNLIKVVEGVPQKEPESLLTVVPVSIKESEGKKYTVYQTLTSVKRREMVLMRLDYQYDNSKFKESKTRLNFKVLSLYQKRPTAETGSPKIKAFETIKLFLENRGILHVVEKDIEKIENHTLENQNKVLIDILEKIAGNLSKFDGDSFTEQMMFGLVEIISINFEMFHEEFLHDCIWRQILRVCGIVMSCIWHTKDMEVFICSDLNLNKGDENCRPVTKSVANLQRFASFLLGIERAENVLQNDINDLKMNTAFCEELECLSGLKEKSRSNPQLVLTWVKVSILQQTILWQMYAVAKFPGHSDKVANHLRRIIFLQRGNDVKFLEKCKITAERNMTIANKYKTCLGFESHMDIPTNEPETDKNEKSRCAIS